MKKFLALALSLMLVLALAACGGASSAPASSSAPSAAGASSAPVSGGEGGGLHIGLSMNALDEYQTSWLNFFQPYLEGLGHTLTVTNAESKVDKQLSDVESLIQLAPDVIAIKAVDPDGAVPCVDACNAAGIPSVDMDMTIYAEDTVHVISDQTGYGTVTGEFANQWLEANPDENIRMGYLIGVDVPTVIGRFTGITDAMDAAGNTERYEVLTTKVCNWSATEAMAVVEDWMQAYPDMNWICAMSDEMAIAAIQVVEAAGKSDEIIITGVDGSANALVEIEAGRLTGTALIPAQPAAEAGADIVVRTGSGEFETLKGQTFDVGEELIQFVSIENLAEIKAQYNL